MGLTKNIKGTLLAGATLAGGTVILGTNVSADTHVVVNQGETVSELAEQYDSSVDKIKKANNLQSDTLKIYANQKLDIPNARNDEWVGKDRSTARIIKQAATNFNATNVNKEVVNSYHASYTNNVTANTAKTINTNTNNDAVVRANAEIGKPYSWGGNNPSTGFDCSGLVQYAYGLGPQYRTTYQQATLGQHRYDIQNAKSGDLFFWGSDSAPYHVAIAEGNGQYIVAPTPGQSVQHGNINSYTPSYYISMN